MHINVLQVGGHVITGAIRGLFTPCRKIGEPDGNANSHERPKIRVPVGRHELQRFRTVVEDIPREFEELPGFSDVRDDGDLKQDKELVQVSANICE